MTPDCTTKVAPCELLFNRKIQGKLPSIERKNVVNKHRWAEENENKSQEYHKRYADKRRNVKQSTIQVGDTVLVRQPRKNKLTSFFNRTPNYEDTNSDFDIDESVESKTTEERKPEQEQRNDATEINRERPEATSRSLQNLFTFEHYWIKYQSLRKGK
eukprot:gene14003-4972_t